MAKTIVLNLVLLELQLYFFYIYFLTTLKTYKVCMFPCRVCRVIRGLPVINLFLNILLNLAHSFSEFFWNLLCISSVFHIWGKEK